VNKNNMFPMHTASVSSKGWRTRVQGDRPLPTFV
jgi:hypothetical protein